MFFMIQCIIIQKTKAQNWSHQQTVIEYLQLTAQKGWISLNDFQQPISRNEILEKLQQIALRNDLSIVEKQDLSRYLKLYQFEANYQDTIPFYSYLDKKPIYDYHALVYKDNSFSLMADPYGQIGKTFFDRNSTILSSGFQIMGKIGKRVGFQMDVRDVNETGAYDSTRTFNNDPGINRKQTTSRNLLNYSEINASMTYQFNKGFIILGQDKHVMGYGKMGNIILSDKSPSFPFVKIQYTPTRWLQFNYMHAWLQSGVIDSTKTYPLDNTVYGGKRQLYVPKFLATHYVMIAPMKGLQIQIGESIVYNDQLDIAYLIPVSFFKSYDNNQSNNNILAGANGQLFAGFSSRNQIPKTHLYGQIFIDEIRVESVFNQSKARNQWAFQLGASVTDVYLPTLTLTAEYTRVNPFVYRNFIPAQNYTSAKYSLGDWMGQNADRMLLQASYRPMSKISTKVFYMQVFKGGLRSAEEQYFGVPQPKFGVDPLFTQKQLGLTLNYEWINNLQIQFSHINTLNRPYLQVGQSQTITSFGIIWSRY